MNRKKVAKNMNANSEALQKISALFAAWEVVQNFLPRPTNDVTIINENEVIKNACDWNKGIKTGKTFHLIYP